MRAANDDKYNDSVFVQLSDAVDRAGNAIYRIGTTAALLDNLWTCSSCQSIGWGWSRHAYWLSDTGEIWFQNSGTHTIRVQTREDGVYIDQIVISPVTYVDDAPGPVSQDATIVPQPAGAAPPALPGSPNPPDGATDVSVTPTLNWTSSAATSYDVAFGTANPPPLVATGLTVAAYEPGTLVYGATYFWRIVAHNSEGSATGPVWTFTTTAAPPTEIVICASDIADAALQGMWTKGADTRSPDGVTLVTANNGWSTTSAPLAEPMHYFEVTFNAEAGVPYRIWLRLRALDNSKYTDAVWVQLSDALANGSPVFQTGTTSGLLVNLATGSTADSLDDWGWQNTAYWLTQPTKVTFANSGTHTIRVQVREDGVLLDQIVLSPQLHLDSEDRCRTIPRLSPNREVARAVDTTREARRRPSASIPSPTPTVPIRSDHAGGSSSSSPRSTSSPSLTLVRAR